MQRKPHSPARAQTTGQVLDRLKVAYQTKKSTVMNLFNRMWRGVSAFLFGPNKDKADQLQAAQDFQDVLREASLCNYPLFVSVRAGGREETVALRPNDELMDFLFRWTQAWIFNIGAGEVQVPVEMPDNFDSSTERQIKQYMRFWAKMMIEDKSFPIMVITRREPNCQGLIATPGYSEEQLQEILDKAKLIVPNILTHIKFSR